MSKGSTDLDVGFANKAKKAVEEYAPLREVLFSQFWGELKKRSGWVVLCWLCSVIASVIATVVLGGFIPVFKALVSNK